MQETEFNVLCQMAATIRAGRAGPLDKVWALAMDDAIRGYAGMLRNRKEIERLVQMLTIPLTQPLTPEPEDITV